jgi:hypothetical protein
MSALCGRTDAFIHTTLPHLWLDSACRLHREMMVKYLENKY